MWNVNSAIILAIVVTGVGVMTKNLDDHLSRVYRRTNGTGVLEKPNNIFCPGIEPRTPHSSVAVATTSLTGQSIFKIIANRYVRK